MMNWLMLAQDMSGAEAAGAGILILLIYLAIYIVFMLPWFFIFQKAGRSGILAFIPIVNLWMWLEIASKPGWWIILYFIPIVNIIIPIIVALSMAENFGQSALVGILLWFPFTTWFVALYLGVGSCEYQPRMVV